MWSIFMKNGLLDKFLMFFMLLILLFNACSSRENLQKKEIEKLIFKAEAEKWRYGMLDLQHFSLKCKKDILVFAKTINSKDSRKCNKNEDCAEFYTYYLGQIPCSKSKEFYLKHKHEILEKECLNDAHKYINRHSKYIPFKIECVNNLCELTNLISLEK